MDNDTTTERVTADDTERSSNVPTLAELTVATKAASAKLRKGTHTTLLEWLDQAERCHLVIHNHKVTGKRQPTRHDTLDDWARSVDLTYNIATKLEKLHPFRHKVLARCDMERESAKIKGKYWKYPTWQEALRWFTEPTVKAIDESSPSVDMPVSDDLAAKLFASQSECKAAVDREFDLQGKLAEATDELAKAKVDISRLYADTDAVNILLATDQTLIEAMADWTVDQFQAWQAEYNGEPEPPPDDASEPVEAAEVDPATIIPEPVAEPSSAASEAADDDDKPEPPKGKRKSKPTIIPEQTPEATLTDIVKHFVKPLANLAFDDGKLMGNDRDKMLYFAVEGPFKDCVEPLIKQYPWMADGDGKRTSIKRIPWDITFPMDTALIKKISSISRLPKTDKMFTYKLENKTLYLVFDHDKGIASSDVPVAENVDDVAKACLAFDRRHYFDRKFFLSVLKSVADSHCEVSIYHKGVMGVSIQTDIATYKIYLRGTTA